MTDLTQNETGTVLDPDGRPVVVPAVLGWKNPDDDGRSLRLYALDRGRSPRWDRSSSPTGRTVECAVAGNTGSDYGRGEGDRYLLVRVGDRYTDEDAVRLFAWLLGTLTEKAATITPEDLRTAHEAVEDRVLEGMQRALTEPIDRG